jgi:hypothetical protein
MSSANISKATALQIIGGINAVESFDPVSLAVDYTDLGTGETRKRLPVMAQIAWFRLKYPEGRIAVSVQPAKDCFVATARVYMHYNDPADYFLAEASASRGPLPEKPTVSPREWAQTAAVGKALRNAGFGLQFDAAGDTFDDPAADELSDAQPSVVTSPAPVDESASETASVTPEVPTAEPEPMTFEAAQKLPCPIAKYTGKTLGDLITLDPKALVWIAGKFEENSDIGKAARLICEQAINAAG